MLTKLLWLNILVSSVLLANAANRPPSFFYSAKGKAAFVDLLSADYTVDYYVEGKKGLATSELQFKMLEDGFPVLECDNDVIVAYIDNAKVETEKIDLPGKVGKMTLIKKYLSKGTYNILIRNEIKKNIAFEEKGVQSSFWMSDLDRGSKGYLEKYLPTNMEYDQYKMNLKIQIQGGKAEQIVYTNGELISAKNDAYEISFPEYFNASSVYFHLTLKNRFVEIRDSYKSIVDGTEFPLVIYSPNKSLTEDLHKDALKILKELEGDYGKWPHQSVVIYGIGRAWLGGMEYAGATRTDLNALGHELHHSYFARGVMPANGDAGWIDEAIARWRDNKYPVRKTFSAQANLGNRSPYLKTTHIKSYTHGMKFISYLASKVGGKDALKSLLARLVDTRVFKPIQNKDFINHLETSSKANLKNLFNKHVLNIRANIQEREKNHSIEENPYHLPETEEFQLSTL
ncbi:hypothetical protein N9N67_08860 [Bacteriovoracaceae bacterium]|nr:hypothetical protein [Bacteriovoracaceae bacterium]